MYVCLCKGLTEADVRQAALLEHAADRLDADRLAQTLGIDDEECCGRCVKNIRQLAGLAADCRACIAAPRSLPCSSAISQPQS